MSSNIEQVIEDVICADLFSIRVTALAWDVNRSTLTRRLNENVSYSEGHVKQQLLSITQEKMLVNWILEQECLGHAPTHQHVREFVTQICDFSDGDSYIDKN